MLVVIAIISILAGMLLPALAAAREKARQADCLSKLKNICYAISQYSMSYQETFPYWDSADPTHSLGLLYPQPLSPPGIFRCPSSNDQTKLVAYDVPLDPTSGITRKQYRFGIKPEWTSYGFDNHVSKKGSELSPIVADMDGTSIVTGRSATSNHDGGQNILYLGLHAAWTNQNTWDNNGRMDNIYVAEGTDPDDDTFISRLQTGATTTTLPPAP